MTTGRNEPCPCGSGKKFKRCCGAGERLPLRAVVSDPAAGKDGRSIPTIVNADGHATVYTRSTYEVGDSEAVLIEISGWRPKPDLNVRRDGGGQLESFEAHFQRKGRDRRHPGDRVLVARLEWTKGGYFVVETNSTERDREIRETLAPLTPMDLRFLRTEGRSAYFMMSEPVLEEEARRSDREEKELLEIPEVRARLGGIMASYSKRWCDEAIPVLGDRRPRTLVKTAAGQAKVLALIEQFESGPQPPGGIGGMDFALIRRELGLPPRS